VLLSAEPKLAKAFGQFQKRAADPELKMFCKRGVTYTNRRVGRLKAGCRALGLKAQTKDSASLAGLKEDALGFAVGNSPHERDAAILAAIEPISHYGLAVYTSIDRYLRGSLTTSMASSV
jgi:ferritin-like metal-binding protein YciE